MKYAVLAHYTNGHNVPYLYEGDAEYKGKFESVEDRIKRHFTSKYVLSYEVKKTEAKNKSSIKFE